MGYALACTCSIGIQRFRTIRTDRDAIPYRDFYVIMLQKLDSITTYYYLPKNCQFSKYWLDIRGTVVPILIIVHIFSYSAPLLKLWICPWVFSSFTYFYWYRSSWKQQAWLEIFWRVEVMYILLNKLWKNSNTVVVGGGWRRVTHVDISAGDHCVTELVVSSIVAAQTARHMHAWYILPGVGWNHCKWYRSETVWY